MSPKLTKVYHQHPRHLPKNFPCWGWKKNMPKEWMRSAAISKKKEQSTSVSLCIQWLKFNQIMFFLKSSQILSDFVGSHMPLSWDLPSLEVTTWHKCYYNNYQNLSMWASCVAWFIFTSNSKSSFRVLKLEAFKHFLNATQRITLVKTECSHHCQRTNKQKNSSNGFNI